MVSASKALFISIVFSLTLFSTSAYAKEKPTLINTILKNYAEENQLLIITKTNTEDSVSLLGKSEKIKDFDELLAVLKLVDTTAYKDGNKLVVIPLKNARFSPIPVVEEGQSYPDNLFVTDQYKANNLCAMKVLPMIRPLIPMHSHIAVYASTNTLVISDTYKNIKRVKHMLNNLDAQLEQPEHCSPKSAS